MAQNNGKAKKESWSDEYVMALCDFLNKYIMKNGRNSPFKWSDLQPEFEKLINHKFLSERALKNKYDTLRKDYNLWKSLKIGATGLGWKESTKTLDCDNEWWENKIKENSNVRKLRKKQPSIELQGAWDQLFGDAVASGIDCVAASMDPNTLNHAQFQNIEDEDDEFDDDVEVTQVNKNFSSRLENLENQTEGFFGKFLDTFEEEDATPENEIGTSNQNHEAVKPKSIKMKRKGRQSAGSVMFKEHISDSKATQKLLLHILESEASTINQSSKFSGDAVASVLNHLIEKGMMVSGDDMWLFAMDLFEDPVKREMFMTITDDDTRMKWTIMDIERRKKIRKIQCAATLLELITASDLAAEYYYKYIYKEPCMTSPQTGEVWMNEVLNGNPIRSVNAFRMHPDVFKKLCRELESKYGLKSSDKMSSLEKLAIFVYTLAVGLSNRDVGERFQRSGETISRAFHDVLEAVTSRGTGFQGLARDIIRPKDPTFPTPPQITNDTRYMPYFKDCIGCIDGTHIQACIPEKQQLRYIGRKGIPTFNVMATCDFNMCFTFISVGWEGSAHDTRVFLHAINTLSMNFPKPPEGKYYLVDKGYPDRKGYLVPYSKTRYHKSQFQNEPPNNMQEAFNRSHSSLRSYIERSFGILKKRWKILGKMPQFSVQTQIDVIIAAFALHNYIRNSSEEDMMFTAFEQRPDYIPRDELPDVRAYQTNNDNLSEGTSNEMKQIRNDIATSIWNARGR